MQLFLGILITIIITGIWGYYVDIRQSHSVKAFIGRFIFMAIITIIIQSYYYFYK